MLGGIGNMKIDRVSRRRVIGMDGRRSRIGERERHKEGKTRTKSVW